MATYRPKDWLIADVTEQQAIDLGTRSGPWWNTETLGIPARAMLSQPIAMRLAESAKRFDASTIGGIDKDKPVVSKTGEVTWDNAGKSMTVISPRSRTFVGKLPDGDIKLGDVTVALLPNRQNWATVSLTAMDGADFTSAGRILIVATGYAENTDMGWKDEKKNTVGKDWGKSPSLVEGIGGTITLPVPNERIVSVHALDERGQRAKGYPAMRGKNGNSEIILSDGFKTLWYEVVLR